MERQIITFSANEQCLQKTGGIDCYASNTVSYIEARFDLGENWSGYDSVRAVWRNDYNKTVATVLDSDGTCIVPYEVLTRKSAVKVNLVGSIAENDVLTDRLTTCPVIALTIKCNAKTDGDNTQPITPSEYEQFVAEVKADAGRAEEGATAAAASASSAAASATSASGSATDASQSANGAAQAAQSASESAESASESAQSASDSAADAEEAKDTILNMTATATTLPEGSSATVDYNNGVMAFGIPRGDKGATGAKGDKGDTGATPNLTIGTVETLEPTEDATASITGTAEEPILNLGIPKGDTGEVSYEELSSLLPRDTASGDIVTIPDGQSVIPAESLKVELEPIQDLNGYDHPWVGGAGKNLFDSSVFTASASQTILYIHYEVQNGTYTMSTPGFPLVGGITNVYFLAGAVSSGASSGSNGVSQSTPITITVTDGYYTVAYRSTNDINTNNPTNFKWQIEVGNSATAYEPHSNICPISGHTDVVTQRTGVNVWDEEWEVGAIVNGANYTSSTNIRSTNYIPCSGGTTYYSRCSAQIALFQYDANKSLLKPTTGRPYILVNSSTTFTTLENTEYMRFYVQPAYGTTYNHDISINYPSTDHEYHAYDGHTYTTALGQTVYGGTLDVVSGELVVDRGYIASYNGETLPSTWISDRDEYASGTTPTIGAEVVYELANPHTYQLTPQEIKLLLGTNNIWSDGKVTLTYNADVTKWLEKKLNGNSTTLTMSRPMTAELNETEETETE